MARCVGITADVTTDKWNLDRGYPTMFNWQIVSSDLTYDEAQKIKLEYKAKGYKTTQDMENNIFFFLITIYFIFTKLIKAGSNASKDIFVL